ncbi:MAG: tetratricopeptide repeat-containing sensor histidine kinase [Bacteroidota bacterium]
MRFIALILFPVLLYGNYYPADVKKEKSVDKKHNRLKDSMDFYFNSNPAKSLNYALELLPHVEKSSDENEIARLYHNLGFLYYNLTKYKEAIMYYDMSLAIKEDMPSDISDIENTYNNIGLVYFEWADYENAIKYYQKALEINKKLGNKEREATNLNNIGLVYSDIGDITNTLDYHNKALDLRKAIDDKKGISSSLNNIGNTYYSIGELEISLDFYKQSLEIKQELDDLRGIANSLNNIGLIYIDLEKYDIAKDYLYKSLEIKKKINNKKGIASTLTNLGNLYKGTKDYIKALDYFNQSLFLSDSLNLINDKIEIFKSYSDVYISLKDYYKALKYSLLYHNLKDSVIDENTKVKINKLKTKYEYEQSEHEIETLKAEKLIQDIRLKKSNSQINLMLIISILSLGIIIIIFLQYRSQGKLNRLLNEKNDKLKEINEKLAQSEQELKLINASKDKFFSIISHDLRNPFNVLLGFSELLAMKSKSLDDAKIHKYNNAVYKSSRQLFNLLDNLLKWSQTQLGTIENIPKVNNLKAIINENIELLKINSEEKQLRIRTNIVTDIFIYADKNLISTIIRNLLINAIKFSYPGNEIVISSKESNSSIIISIIDFGIGISETDLNNLFKIDQRLSLEGTLQEKGTGLGLVLCKEFIDIAGGEISAESELGKGSTFTFSIPMKV